MNTKHAMMDAWRDKFNKLFNTYMAMNEAPFLFKQEYIDEVVKDMKHAESQYMRWANLPD